MPPEPRDAEIGLLLAAFVVFIAAVLAYRQWNDRRGRMISTGPKPPTITGRTSAGGSASSS